MAALAQSKRAVYLPYFAPRIATRPECRTQWRAPLEAAQLWQAVTATQTPEIAPAHQARLWARLVWEKINYADFPDAETRARFEDDVQALSAGLEGLAQARLDPFIGAKVRAVLGLSKA